MPPAIPPAEEVRSQFKRIINSATFQKKRRLKEFLSFIVENTLAGKNDDINEKNIGQRVFNKVIASGENSIVRANAARLRFDLASYYRSTGRRDQLKILLPEVGYVPIIKYRESRSGKKDQPSSNLEVRTLCNEGWHHLQRLVGTSLAEALEYFEKAARLEPSHIDAYCGIADSYVFLAIFGLISGIQAKSRAEAAISTALQYDPRSAKFWGSAATIHVMFGRDWDRAKIEFRRSLKPKATWKAHFDFAVNYLLLKGQFKEAQKQLKLAREKALSSPRIILHQAILHYAQRQYKAAIDCCNEGMSMHRNLGGFQFWLGHIYCAQGDYEQAAHQFAESLTRGPFLFTRGHQAFCKGLMGNTEEAELILRELVNARKTGHVPPHAIALAHLGLNQIGEAFEWFERAIEEYDPWSLLLLSVDPWRHDQPAQALLKRVNLS